MCRLFTHTCPACGEEYRCDQNNSECPVLNGYEAVCSKCEYWSEELEREDKEREWNRERWEDEFPFDEE